MLPSSITSVLGKRDYYQVESAETEGIEELRALVKEYLTLSKDGRPSNIDKFFAHFAQYPKIKELLEDYIIFKSLRAMNPEMSLSPEMELRETGAQLLQIDAMFTNLIDFHLFGIALWELPSFRTDLAPYFTLLENAVLSRTATCAFPPALIFFVCGAKLENGELPEQAYHLLWKWHEHFTSFRPFCSYWQTALRNGGVLKGLKGADAVVAYIRFLLTRNRPNTPRILDNHLWWLKEREEKDIVARVYTVISNNLNPAVAKSSLIFIKILYKDGAKEQREALEKMIPLLIPVDPLYVAQQLMENFPHPDNAPWLEEAVMKCPREQLFSLFRTCVPFRRVLLPPAALSLLIKRAVVAHDQFTKLLELALASGESKKNEDFDLLYTHIVPTIALAREGMTSEEEFQVLQVWLQIAPSGGQHTLFPVMLWAFSYYVDFPLFLEKMTSEDYYLTRLKSIAMQGLSFLPVKPLRGLSPNTPCDRILAAHFFPEDYEHPKYSLEEIFESSTDAMEKLLMLSLSPNVYEQVAETLDEFMDWVCRCSGEPKFNFTLFCKTLIKISQQCEEVADNLLSSVNFFKTIFTHTYQAARTKGERYRWLIQFAELVELHPSLIDGFKDAITPFPLFTPEEAAHFRPAHKVALLKAFRSLTPVKTPLMGWFPEPLLLALMDPHTTLETIRHYKALTGRELPMERHLTLHTRLERRMINGKLI